MKHCLNQFLNHWSPLVSSANTQFLNSALCLPFLSFSFGSSAGRLTILYFSSIMNGQTAAVGIDSTSSISQSFIVLLCVFVLLLLTLYLQHTWVKKFKLSCGTRTLNSVHQNTCVQSSASALQLPLMLKWCLAVNSFEFPT